nr:nicotinamide riboside transporter PnuC [bacterium]
GGSLPFADAFTTAASVAALLMSVKMYMEQWIVWIAVDVLTIIMWGIACASGGASAATLIMWICYLLNGIIMFIKWERESRENDPESQHGKVTQHGRL